MTFAWPHFLWLLLVPVGLLTWELTRRRNGRAKLNHPKILRAEIGTHELAQVRESSDAVGRRARPWLALGLAFAVVALARPQWGRVDEPVFDQSREILIAVDLSRSMLAQDVKPSRLERSKLLIQALLEKLKGERVGLVVFSGTAFLQSPLSADYEILREFLPALTPDFLPEGGTNYRALIDTSLDAFGAGSAADRFLIILSDGEATDDNWKPKVDELKKKGIRVIGLGVGTIAGTMIPDGSGGFVKDDRGAVVLSKLESGTLQQLAESTGGVYRDASTWIDLASLIDQTVNAAKKGAFEDRNTIRLVERFQWPLALALWCFLVSLYFEFPVRPRTRAISLRTAAPGSPGKSPADKVTATLIALLLLPAVVFAPRARAAVKIAPPAVVPNAPAAPAAPSTQPPTAAITAPSMLGKIVSRLSQQDTLTAPDLSELAHETVNWGQALKSAGQPVPEGPVHDALAAVDQLEARGGKMADYSDLRKQLEALLEKPEKKNPPPQKQPPKQDQKDQQDKSQPKDQSSSPQNQDKQQNQDNQKQDQQNQQNKPEDKDGNQQNKSGEKSEPQQPSQSKPNESAFGDMTKKPKPPPPQPSDNTQKVGGEEEMRPSEPTDPALALPMDKLDQLRNHDSPAELFQLMQPDRSEGTRKKPAKDW